MNYRGNFKFEGIFSLRFKGSKFQLKFLPSVALYQCRSNKTSTKTDKPTLDPLLHAAYLSKKESYYFL